MSGFFIMLTERMNVRSFILFAVCLLVSFQWFTQIFLLCEEVLHPQQQTIVEEEEGEHVKIGIAYLTQGPAKSFSRWKTTFQEYGGPTAKLYYHSYDEACVDAGDAEEETTNENSQCLFAKGTSFQQGRNLLLAAALHDDSNSSMAMKIKYFVFFDDDIELLCGDPMYKVGPVHYNNQRVARGDFFNETDTYTSCWKSFHEMLMNLDENSARQEEIATTASSFYPFVKPMDLMRDWGEENTTTYQTCVDDNFLAIHKDLIWFFFPYPVNVAAGNWWITNEMQWMLSNRCFPNAWKVDGRWGVVNWMHRPYPRNRIVASDKLQSMEDTFPELSPWENASSLPTSHRCSVVSEFSSTSARGGAMESKCENVLWRRFQEWVSSPRSQQHDQ